MPRFLLSEGGQSASTIGLQFSYCSTGRPVLCNPLFAGGAFVLLEYLAGGNTGNRLEPAVGDFRPQLCHGAEISVAGAPSVSLNRKSWHATSPAACSSSSDCRPA